jgi:hypothetical protein
MQLKALFTLALFVALGVAKPAFLNRQRGVLDLSAIL